MPLVSEFRNHGIVVLLPLPTRIVAVLIVAIDSAYNVLPDHNRGKHKKRHIQATYQNLLYGIYYFARSVIRRDESQDGLNPFLVFCTVLLYTLLSLAADYS